MLSDLNAAAYILVQIQTRFCHGSKQYEPWYMLMDSSIIGYFNILVLYIFMYYTPPKLYPNNLLDSNYHVFTSQGENRIYIWVKYGYD